MARHALLYGIALAAAAFVLEWLELQHGLKRWSASAYVVAVAIGFAALGLWAGHRLTARPRPPFERNVAVLASLGISPRELEVLDLLAQGCANKVIARRLGISPNTVKTHVTALFEKLEANNRTEAVGKARMHRILP